MTEQNNENTLKPIKVLEKQNENAYDNCKVIIENQSNCFFKNL